MLKDGPDPQILMRRLSWESYTGYESIDLDPVSANFHPKGSSFIQFKLLVQNTLHAVNFEW